ncbi:MAG: LCP family protein [Mobilitalea sp.]
MGNDNDNSTFEFDFGPEFSRNFNDNIEKALNSSDEEAKNAIINEGINVEKKVEELSSANEKSEIVSEETDNTNIIDSSSAGVNDERSQAVDQEYEENTASEFNLQHEGMNSVPTADQVRADDDITDTLVDINADLAKQISDQMDTIGVEKQLNAKKRKIFKIKGGLVLALLCIIGFGFLLGGTKPGNRILMGIGVDASSFIWSAWTGFFDKDVVKTADSDYVDAEDLSSEAVEVDASQIIWPEHPGEGRQEEGVYNILLLGEEAIGSGEGRGRTDVIIIATLNTNNKTIKLTSLMRDTYLQIPGYQDNKLNSAYEKGGVDLLYETIAMNFDIQLDGCALVNFEEFEKIIDSLGGLELTLTSGEAAYLNKTNYISNPEYRNLVEGTQLLNGNQVMGYCRVRKTATITGNNNDYGRTDRHRIVLNAIFDKYKTKSKVELAATLLEILPMITTDIDSDNFEVLLNSFIEMGTMEMEQLRIPADGTFTDNIKVRGMSVVIPDLPSNITILQDFIFGAPITSSTTGTTANSTTGTELDNTTSTVTDSTVTE